MAELDILWCDSDEGDLGEEEEEKFSHNNVEEDMQGDFDNSNEVILLAMFDEHGQQLECPSLPLGPAPSTEPAQVIPPLPVSPSSSRNVRPEVVVVGLDEENGNEYFLAEQHEVCHEEVVASSSGGGVRGVRLPAAGGRWARGGGAHTTAVQQCVTDDDVPEYLRNRILRVVADREARERRAERRRMEVDNDDVADHIGHAALFKGDATSLHFDWRPMDSFQGERETFLPEGTGPTTPSGSAYEAFRQYWDESIMSHIATETNRYAVELACINDTFARNWYETNTHG
ncbi:unnamed protein product [Parnassius mnemosyne]|uniref:Uncharacterized protein n=1 Tax=Parnassius mnemosyne TaxID=213953 RepID=A0AAV1M9B6_9NEOP